MSVVFQYTSHLSAQCFHRTAPLPSQNFTEFTGNNRTLITQMITSICFLEDAQWGEAEDRANHPTVRKRPGRNKTWKKAGTTFQNHRERARAQCSVIPSLAATEKVNKVFSQIASYVKEPSSTKDNKNDYFLTHI